MPSRVSLPLKKWKKRRPFPQSPWHIHNWGQSLNLATLWLIARLPPQLAMALGRRLGRIGYHLARERRSIAQQNINRCLPHLSAPEREQLARDNFAAVGQAIAETALAWYGGPSVDDIPCVVRGEHHLETARANNGRVILLSAHFLSMELVARLAPKRLALAALYKPMRKRPILDQAMYRRRRAHVRTVLARDDLRGLVRATRRGDAFCFFGDQDYGKHHSIWVPFFGHQAATVTSLPRLAKLAQAAVVPMAFYWEGDVFVIEFDQALADYPSSDIEADVIRMNQTLETAIKAHPVQYLWMHRRFKRA